VISAVPNPARDANNDGHAVVALSVSNSSNDINNWSFTWDFGDGTFNTMVLTGFTKGFAVGCDEIREYTVRWEGWVRCDNGTDLFKEAFKVVTVLGFCVGGGGEDPTPPAF
jgi:hypothetical protein